MNSIQKGDFAHQLYRGEGNVRIEQEVTLPDYCPDVTRLIRVEITPVFEKSRAYLQDNTLNIEVSGRAEFCALYTDGAEGCEVFSFTQPFSETFKRDVGKNIGILPESIALCVTPVCVTPTPRVLSPRKLLLRGELRMLLEVFANLEYSAYDPCEALSSHCIDVEREERYVSRIVSSKTEDYRVNQEIKLPSGMPSCEKILSCSADINVESVHPTSDSASVFLGVNFNVLYLSEQSGEREAEYVSFYQPVEVRETLSCDDCAEDSVCRVRAMSGKVNCSIIADSFGENRIISLDMPYSLTCIIFENIETSFVTDAYGVGRNAKTENTSREFSGYIGSVSESTPFREKLNLKSDTSSVHGARTCAVLKNVSVGADGAFADVSIEVSVINSADGELKSGSSESFDVRVPINLPDSIMTKTAPESIVCDATVLPAFVDAQVSSGALEVSGELVVQAQLWEKTGAEFVSSVSFSDREMPSGKTVFYYPSPEDTLWDIGKRYGVEREKIRQANSIEGNTLPSVCKIPL